MSVKDDAEAAAILQQAMKPTDIGDLEGPCPRYIVPTGGGQLDLPDNLDDIDDIDKYIRQQAAPRQQMASEWNGRERYVDCIYVECNSGFSVSSLLCVVLIEIPLAIQFGLLRVYVCGMH